MPLIDSSYQSNVKGLYIVGDLANSPVIRTAINQGVDVIDSIAALPDARSNREGVLDVIICGAGAAGLAAAFQARERNLSFRIIEKRDIASTIQDFAKGKPIFAEPASIPARGALWIEDCSKEELLQRWEETIASKGLEVSTYEEVRSIRKKGDEFVVATDKGSCLARRVILAIGKRGNPRRLGAPGEHLPKVHYKLSNPSDYAGREVLVVGGGDSAVENALALADIANVTLSYRRDAFARIRKRNEEAISKAAQDGRVRILWNSTVKEITPERVILDHQGKSVDLPNDEVFVQIGADQPVDFLLDCGIVFEGQWTARRWAALAVSGLFAYSIYSLTKEKGDAPLRYIGSLFGLPYEGPGSLTSRFSTALSFADFTNAWDSGIMRSFLAIVASSCVFLAVLGLFKRLERWKYLSMAGGLLGFTLLFLACSSFGLATQGGAQYGPGFWYTVLYCILMIVFGIEAMWRWKDSRYQMWRYASLLFFQVFFFFILPEVIMRLAYAGTDHRWDYWRWYGLFYAWPLFWNTFFDAPFWFIVWGAVLTFVLMPVLVLFHGKRYCSWVCGCGGLAETLGDRWRHLAPKGERAIAWEKMNLVVLIIAVAITAIHLIKTQVLGATTVIFSDPFSASMTGGAPLTTTHLIHTYSWIVDYLLVGVIPVALYPIMGGKIWCRYWCPLAKYMEILSAWFTRRGWSRFGIKSNDHCISCGQCTRYCQVGIDVMSFAQKQEILDNANSSCIGCGICLDVCPVDVLSFGTRREKQQ